MSEMELGNAVASNLTGTVTDYSVPTQDTDAAFEQK